MNTVGIDMSKDTFHAAFDEHEVLIFDNSLSGIKKFIRSLTTHTFILTDTVIGVEATGAHHLLFCEQLRKKKWQIKVINPLLTHKAISSSLHGVKTDKHDAIAIRAILATGVGYIYTDTPEILELKTAVQEREALVKMRTTIKQRTIAHVLKEKAVQSHFHDSFESVFEAISEEISHLESRMTNYVPDTQALLRSIPGIGKQSAALLVAYVGDIHRFETPEKLVAYIGLDPRVYQSGTSIHGKGYISKRGNAYMRHALFNAAFIARRRNPQLKTYFEKKIKEGKHYFSVMCAIERKLIHIIHAVWTRGTPFESR